MLRGSTGVISVEWSLEVQSLDRDYTAGAAH